MSDEKDIIQRAYEQKVVDLFVVLVSNISSSDSDNKIMKKEVDNARAEFVEGLRIVRLAKQTALEEISK